MCVPLSLSLTDVLVVDGDEDVDGPLHPQETQAEQHQPLEEDAPAGPHVGQQQPHLGPEALPRRLVLLLLLPPLRPGGRDPAH